MSKKVLSPLLSFLRRPVLLFLVFSEVSSLLFFSARSYAQWEYIRSYRYGYSLYEDQTEAIFFPKKEPEEQEVTLGPVTIRPGVGLSETYSDNLTLKNDNPREDFVTKAFPALLLHLPYRSHSVEFEYMGAFSWHEENPKYDADEHVFRGKITLRSVRPVTLKLTQVFGVFKTPVEDIPHQTNLNPALLDRRRGYNHYMTDFDLRYEKDRTSADLSYRVAINEFHRDIDSLDDYERHEPRIVFGYRIVRKLILLAGYQFTDFNNKRPSTVTSIDHQTHKVSLQARTVLGRKININMEGNFSWRAYEVFGRSNFLGAAADLVYDPAERLTVYLNYRRDSSPVFVYQSGGSFGSAFFDSDHVSFSIKYRLRHNLLIFCNAIYRHFDYPRETTTTETRRSDHQVGGAGQIVYEWRPWLRFSLAGGHSLLDSTVSLENFAETRTTFYVQAAL